MKQLISSCPICHEPLQVATFRCTSCGTELNGSFDLGPFDRLSEEQFAFLTEFLRCRGSLKEVQSHMNISYPTAKKKLDGLLEALDLADASAPVEAAPVDPGRWSVDGHSVKASEIIRSKLKECGGRAVVRTVQGLPCEIWGSEDGTKLVSDKLPPSLYGFDVFDCIVELLYAHGGRARKGNGRNYKLGDPHCDDSTVVGYIARHYRGQEDGVSVFDPVFVLAAVLDWADIAHNERGELRLTAGYLQKAGSQ